MKMDVYERFSYGMNDTSVRCYLRAVLTALAHAHLRGVCHRDVALENTLWDPRQSTFVLIDFEGAALHRPQGYSSDVGRDGYDAPEKTRCLRRAGAYTERAELYSVGVMFWRLVRGGGGGSGKVPSHQATAKWLQKMHWRAERPAGADLMSRLLAHDPNDRITAEHALAHAYFEDK
jgi:serine/threonine protein kinase